MHEIKKLEKWCVSNLELLSMYTVYMYMYTIVCSMYWYMCLFVRSWMLGKFTFPIQLASISVISPVSIVERVCLFSVGCSPHSTMWLHLARAPCSGCASERKCVCLAVDRITAPQSTSAQRELSLPSSASVDVTSHHVQLASRTLLCAEFENSSEERAAFGCLTTDSCCVLFLLRGFQKFFFARIILR